MRIQGGNGTNIDRGACAHRSTGGKDARNVNLGNMTFQAPSINQGDAGKKQVCAGNLPVGQQSNGYSLIKPWIGRLDGNMTLFLRDRLAGNNHAYAAVGTVAAKIAT